MVQLSQFTLVNSNWAAEEERGDVFKHPQPETDAELQQQHEYLRIFKKKLWR